MRKEAREAFFGPDKNILLPAFIHYYSHLLPTGTSCTSSPSAKVSLSPTEEREGLLRLNHRPEVNGGSLFAD